MNITHLGEPRFPSPIRRTVEDALSVPEQLVRAPQSPPTSELRFELAGPRAGSSLIRLRRAPGS